MKRSAILVLLVVMCFFLGACVLFKPSASKMTKRALKAHKQYDAVIVPGIQFVEPAWDKVLQLRLIWAKHLFDKGITKNIITSGTSVYTPYVEAQVMAEIVMVVLGEIDVGPGHVRGA